MTDIDTRAEDPAVSSGDTGKWVKRGGIAIAAAAILAACGNNDDDTATATTTGAGAGSGGSTATSMPSTTGSAAGSGDAKVATLAAGLEVLAVGTYKAALDAATGGKLGTVPPAVANFVQTAMAHHQQALDSWNGVLRAAGQPAVSQPPAALKSVVDQQFAQVKDVGGAAKLALLLEQTAADTYLSATAGLQDKDAITLAGALQSVDQEHAAILLYVLGQYPVPDVFQKTEKAFKG